ncbi:MAG TPA: hypothetical protein PKA00_05710 [Saprospiraceae bacterium]|nr:hypothetical protein [Saprospiraceae bacterium]HMQ82378.1 hypothetical protein [Saprospiraceae bacterium]
MFKNIFYSSIRIPCNLGRKDFVEVFSSWTKSKNDWNNMISYEYYIKKIIDNNRVVVPKFTSKVIEAQDIYINYKKDKRVLDITIKPALRSFSLFLVVPLSVFVLASTKSLKVEFWLIPILALLFLILFFKWMIKKEEKEVVASIEEKLKTLR